jgi:hypothetical protein
MWVLIAFVMQMNVSRAIYVFDRVATSHLVLLGEKESVDNHFPFAHAT